MRLLTLFVLAVASMATATPVSPKLRILSDRALPRIAAFDVRWLDDQRVAIGNRDGVVTVDISAKELKGIPLPEWPRPTSFGTLPQHVAVSNDRLAASDLFFMVRWHARQGSSAGMVMFSYIADFDLDGDRLLINGLRRGEKAAVMNGAVAWLGSLRGGEESLKPILPFHSLDAIQDCTGFGFGVARFVEDGSFIVVPGTEPDIYLFGADARLQRTWHTDALGVDARCALSAEQKADLPVNPFGRNQWVNRRTMIDDIVPTPEGPLVIIRARRHGKTTWEAALLKDDKPATFPLPFTSDSPWAHVSADTRGRRTVFLIAERLLLDAESSSPRIVLAQWSDH